MVQLCGSPDECGKEYPYNRSPDSVVRIYCNSARWWFDNKVWFIPIMCIIAMLLFCYLGFVVYKKRTEGKETDYDIPAVGGGIYSAGATTGKANPFAHDKKEEGAKLEEDQ